MLLNQKTHVLMFTLSLVIFGKVNRGFNFASSAYLKRINEENQLLKEHLRVYIARLRIKIFYVISRSSLKPAVVAQSLEYGDVKLVWVTVIPFASQIGFLHKESNNN